MSPDNLLLWDRPEQTGFGLWGHAEPLVYYDSRIEAVPVTVWRLTTGRGLLNGRVLYLGRPVPGALVNAGGVTDHADPDGWYELELGAGPYPVTASALIDGVGQASATEIVTVPAGGAAITEDIELRPPPENYRRVRIIAQVNMRDDEFSADPFEDDPDDYAFDRQFKELRVSTENRRDMWSYTRGWGGECRIEADITAHYQDDHSISLTLHGVLYEGATENTNDKDGEGSRTWRIPQDAMDVTHDAAGQELKIRIWNTDEDEPDTYAEFVLTVSNEAE